MSSAVRTRLCANRHRPTGTAARRVGNVARTGAKIGANAGKMRANGGRTAGRIGANAVPTAARPGATIAAMPIAISAITATSATSGTGVKTAIATSARPIAAAITVVITMDVVGTIIASGTAPTGGAISAMTGTAIARPIAACSISGGIIRPIAITDTIGFRSASRSGAGSIRTATPSTIRGAIACPKSTAHIAGYAITTTCCWSISTAVKWSTRSTTSSGKSVCFVRRL